MKILYFDCFSGISGDMSLGALISLGVPEAFLIESLGKLNVDGWHIETSHVFKSGIQALAVNVTPKEEHAHRTYREICGLIDGSGLNERVKTLSKNIFNRVAKAEANVHGKAIDEVHFHEVGALDSIIDIVGVAVCIDYLKPDRICASVIHDGHGFVRCQHGQIPVPVPAVLEIFSQEKVIAKQVDIPAELVTPTGAAIITEIAESYGIMPEMNVLKVGYGAGSRDLSIPNVLRVTLGESSGQSRYITVLETNIDDCNPEILGYVMERLFEAGAKDVFFTNIQMKKNRPAVMLTVLCDDKKAADLTRIIFKETTTIGVRSRRETRVCLEREIKTIRTVLGDLQVKSSVLEGVEYISPEFESAKRLAQKNNIPLLRVYDVVKGQSAQA